MMRSRFRSILLVSALALTPAQAWAQNADRERVAELERQLALQEAALLQLRSQVEAMKSQLATPQAPTTTVTTTPATYEITESNKEFCTLAKDKLTEAVKQPHRLTECHRFSPISVGLPDIAALATLQPARPLQATGITPQFEFGATDRATLTLAIPFFGRTRFSGPDCLDDCFAPQVWTATAQVSHVLDKGKGSLFDFRTRESARDLDFVTGTSLKLGIDYLRFSPATPTVKMAESLESLLNGEARKACLVEQHDNRIRSGNVLSGDDTKCDRTKIAEWLFAPTEMNTSPSGYAFKYADLVGKLHAILWRAEVNAVPNWGLGGSVTFSNNDFSFQQAKLDRVLGSSGKFVLQPDRSVALGSETTENHSNWLFEFHGLKYFSFGNESREGQPNLKFTPRFNVPGLMVLPQVQWQEDWRFRDGANKIICPTSGALVVPNPLVSVPEFNVFNCSAANLDRPYRYRWWTASIEGRLRVENFPGIGSIGFAPRFAYQFDTGGMTFDMSMFLQNKDGSLSGGLRYRHRRNHVDDLGNDEATNSTISLFVTPLKFSGF